MATRLFPAATLIVLTACTPPGPTPVSTPDASGTEPSGSQSAVPESIARAVVAERTGTEPETLEVVSSEYREFSDSGLGCPVEGMAYLQVLTPGYRVLIRHAGQDFDVRVAGSRGRICERPTGEP